MGLLVHRYRDRFVSSASLVENAAAGQVVDLAVVHAEQITADLAGMPGAAFRRAAGHTVPRQTPPEARPSIEIADALLGLAILRVRLPRSWGIAARPHLSSSRAITIWWIWPVPS
jgi:hypothetical protein